MAKKNTNPDKHSKVLDQASKSFDSTLIATDTVSANDILSQVIIELKQRMEFNDFITDYLQGMQSQTEIIDYFNNVGIQYREALHSAPNSAKKIRDGYIEAVSVDRKLLHEIYTLIVKFANATEDTRDDVDMLEAVYLICTQLHREERASVKEHAARTKHILALQNEATDKITREYNNASNKKLSQESNARLRFIKEKQKKDAIANAHKQIASENNNFFPSEVTDERVFLKHILEAIAINDLLGYIHPNFVNDDFDRQWNEDLRCFEYSIKPISSRKIHDDLAKVQMLIEALDNKDQSFSFNEDHVPRELVNAYRDLLNKINNLIITATIAIKRILESRTPFATQIKSARDLLNYYWPRATIHNMSKDLETLPQEIEKIIAAIQKAEQLYLEKPSQQPSNEEETEISEESETFTDSETLYVPTEESYHPNEEEEEAASHTLSAKPLNKHINAALEARNKREEEYKNSKANKRAQENEKNRQKHAERVEKIELEKDQNKASMAKQAKDLVSYKLDYKAITSTNQKNLRILFDPTKKAFDKNFIKNLIESLGGKINTMTGSHVNLTFINHLYVYVDGTMGDKAENVASKSGMALKSEIAGYNLQMVRSAIEKILPDDWQKYDPKSQEQPKNLLLTAYNNTAQDNNTTDAETLSDKKTAKNRTKRKH